MTLPVSARNQSVLVHFIVATGAPRTYIAQAVLDALGVTEQSLPSQVLHITGVKAHVSVSDTARVRLTTPAGDTMEMDCRFKGLNLLGMDFWTGWRASSLWTCQTSRCTCRHHFSQLEQVCVWLHLK
jgi:hypothetical protein